MRGGGRGAERRGGCSKNGVLVCFTLELSSSGLSKLFSDRNPDLREQDLPGFLKVPCLFSVLALEYISFECYDGVMYRHLLSGL